MKVLDKLKFFKKTDYVPHKKQLEIHNSKSRFRIVVAGRRGGKSLMASREAMAHAILPNQMIWIVSPSYELSKKVFRECFWAFHKHLNHWIKSSSESNLSIELVNGSQIIGKSADNPTSLIGEGVHFLIVDECARIGKTVWEEALRPTLSDTEGDALFISTPAGMNWFQRF